MTKVKTNYIVWGDHLSKMVFPSFNEAARFIKYCLDKGHTVKGVTKERKHGNA